MGEMFEDDEGELTMIRGSIIFAVGIILLAVGMNAAANYIESTPSPADEKFQVVDTYQDCDVIRYNPDHSARYSYFLHCK